jgi:hypothetical protein
MAITGNNVVWIGQPGANAASGQSYSNMDPGPLGRQLTGVASLILDGTLTTATINWIDGVQIPFQISLFIPVLSVTAPATIGGVANQAVYSGVGSYGQLRVGQSVTFTGFSNAGNNGTFTVNALTTSSIQVTNASSVAETNPAGTAKFIYPQGEAVVYATGNRAMTSASGVADTAPQTNTVVLSAFTQTGCTATFSAGSAGQQLSIWVQIQAAV